MTSYEEPPPNPVPTKDDLVQMLVRAQLASDSEAINRVNTALTTLESNSKPLVLVPEKTETDIEAKHATTIFNKITELNGSYLNGIAVSMTAGGILGVTLDTFLTQPITATSLLAQSQLLLWWDRVFLSY